MYFSPYLRIGEFILGCLVAQLYMTLQHKSPGRLEQMIGRGLLAMGLVSVPIMLYLMYGGNWAFVRKLNYNFGLAPSVAVIIFCAARYKSVFSRWMNSRPLVALGDASYSIYLVHFLIFVISGSFLGERLSPTMGNVIFLAGKYLFLLGFVLLISLGLHAYVEVPARQWLRNFWRDAKADKKRVLAYSMFAGPAIAAMLLLITVPSDSNAVESGLRVISATYGANCNAPRGNATRSLSNACNAKEHCDYIVDIKTLGDPVNGCQKNFTVEYQCRPDSKRLTKNLAGEAGLGSRLDLSCATDVAGSDDGSLRTARPATSEIKSAMESGIKVLSATYGANCKAPTGNATDALSNSCNGKNNCAYTIDVNVLGDPANGCQKNFAVEYQCSPAGIRTSKSLSAEAGLGSQVDLVCAPEARKDRAVEINTPNGAKPELSAGVIHVVSATYGENCGARPGNATTDAQMSCDSDNKCTYAVDVDRLGDPAGGCEKDFKIDYKCDPDGQTLTAKDPQGKVLELACADAAVQEKTSIPGSGIHIRSASYGANCGAPLGNVSAAVERTCGTKKTCDYIVDVNQLGDPANGCEKGFFVKYQCGGELATRIIGTKPGAGLRELVHLSCP
jgi:hypothetical protein